MTRPFVMHYRFTPKTFVGQPLHLEGGDDEDYRVTIAGHTAGRIFRTMRSSSQHVWLWTVTGPYLPGAELNGNGDSANLSETKTAFRGTFDAWLQWAIQQNAPVMWHE